MHPHDTPVRRCAPCPAPPYRCRSAGATCSRPRPGVCSRSSGCATSAGPPAGTPRAEVAPIETGPVELSVFWWGGDARAKLTDEALALYTAEAPERHVQEDLAGQPGLLRQAGHQPGGKFRRRHLPDRRQLPRRVAARNLTLDLTTTSTAKQSTRPSSPRAWSSTAWSTASWPACRWARTPRAWSTTRPCSPSSARAAADRQDLGGAHRLGHRGQREDQLKTRHPGPERRLQGVLGLAAPAGQGPLQGQEARLHRGGPDQLVRPVEGRPGRQGDPDGRRHPRGQRQRHHQAAGGHRQGRHLVRVGQPDAGAEEEHQGRARRRRLPG